MHILDYVSLRIAPFAVSFQGQPYFDATRLFPTLGIDNVHDAVMAHLLGGQWRMGKNIDQVLVTEGGVYAVLLASPVAEAEVFRQWVSGTVMPAIRKDGGYFLGEAYSQPKGGQKPLTIAHKAELLENVIPALEADGVYIRGEDRLKKARMQRAEFTRLVKEVVSAKCAGIG